MPDLLTELSNTIELVTQEITLERNEFLIREGEMENNIYIVTSGALRAFYVTEFEEQTLRFGYSGSLITSLSSFISGVPSDVYIQAIRKCSLKVISKENFRSFISESLNRTQQYNVLLEKLLVQQWKGKLIFSPFPHQNA